MGQIVLCITKSPHKVEMRIFYKITGVERKRMLVQIPLFFTIVRKKFALS